MFEAPPDRGKMLPQVAGLVAVLALVGAGIWAWRAQSPLPPAATPPPAPAPVAEATPDEVRAAIVGVLAAVPGGRLFHLDCAAPGCTTTIRMPIPEGSAAGWRNQVEHRLGKDGWLLRPAGKVEVFEATRVNDDVLPRRCYWTFGLRRNAPDPEARAVLEARIASQSAEAYFRYDPW
jgi:hypothetical protein